MMYQATGHSAEVPSSIARFGTDEPTADRILLTAGPVSATLEQGALRWLRFGEVEVLRGVAFLVRDRDWGTPDPTIAELVIEQDDAGFRVTFSALCTTADGELPWSAEIVGAADGSIRFTATARPPCDFTTNRTGFVVLHPLDGVAGAPVEIVHTDGTQRRARFPDLVDPQVCFTDIRALMHEALPGVRVTCAMEGDAWEMEDHRNWLDASFKTYVRPLALPYPYVIEAGNAITQSVRLSFAEAAADRLFMSRSSPRDAEAAQIDAYGIAVIRTVDGENG